MDNSAYCSKCTTHHQRPIGRRCEIFEAMAASLQENTSNQVQLTDENELESSRSDIRHSNSSQDNNQPGCSKNPVTQEVNTQATNGSGTDNLILKELR